MTTENESQGRFCPEDTIKALEAHVADLENRLVASESFVRDFEAYFGTMENFFDLFSTLLESK